MHILGLGKALLGQIQTKVDKGAHTAWMEGPKVVDDRERISDRQRADDRWRAAAADGERRYDSAMRLARDRGRMAIGACVIASVMAFCWWNQAQKSSVQTVFIPFDRIGDPGEVFIARPNEPPDIVRNAEAKRLVIAMFAISSDGNINLAYQKQRDSSLRGQAADKWSKWKESTDKDVTEREVHIVSSKPRSKDTINVIWDEIDWRNGHMDPPRREGGDFTLQYIAPTTAGDITANELGLFLVNMTYAREN